MQAPYAVLAFKLKMLDLHAQITLFFSSTSYMLRLNINFLHTTTITVSTSSTY